VRNQHPLSEQHSFRQAVIGGGHEPPITNVDKDAGTHRQLAVTATVGNGNRVSRYALETGKVFWIVSHCLPH
jgi:hypothetical protein